MRGRKAQSVNEQLPDFSDTAVQRFQIIDLPSVAMLADSLIDSVRDREPDFVIGGHENPYMIRWWLRREREAGSIYLHNILRDDDDRALHDHPWDSTSIVLRGELREVLAGERWPGPSNSYQAGESRILRPGSITSRRAEDAHRLEVAKGDVWTLFITGAVRREWGFHCPNGWRHWREFTDPATNGATVGRGCE